MNKWKTAVVLLSVALVGACAAPASRDEMNISEADRVLYQEARPLTGKVVVGEVKGGQDTNPAWTSEIGSIEFKGALEDSLKTARLSSSFALADYVLDAELLEVDQPHFGFTFTVKTTVHYVLKEKSSNRTVIDQVITADGTATTGDAFSGVKRLEIANEKSAQENIKKIIDILYSYDG